MTSGQQEASKSASTLARQATDSPENKIVYGRNGVPILIRDGSRTTGSGYRTYEVHQRLRVGQSTEKIHPTAMLKAAFLEDPYPTLTVLRENYPCYRDWVGNAYWITRYDDVTSVFTDDANFETRPKRWFYGLENYGRDLGDELPVLNAEADRLDMHARPLAERIVDEFSGRGKADLAVEFAARFPLELLAAELDLPVSDFDFFVERYLQMQDGYGWSPQAQERGLQAMAELTDYLRPLLEQRRNTPGDDLISALAGLELEQPVTAEDVVITLLERDHETLHGALANMWYLLLTHPGELSKLRDDERLVKYAYQETVRHTTPVLEAKRFARHEVERFGLLLPEGALLICSAGAANRDPRVFHDPDTFDVTRKDLCRREPRGQYRADGLPTGLTFALGPPTKHPAVPEDRPRSRYAIVRDTAVTASKVLLKNLPNLRLGPGAEPLLRSLRIGSMHACWRLPAVWDS